MRIKMLKTFKRLKNILNRIIFLIIVQMFAMMFTQTIYATEEIIQQQNSAFKIQDFLKETEKYIDEMSEQIDIQEVFSLAIKGQINNKTMFNLVLGILGQEVVGALYGLISILLVIIIHSVLNSISESLESDSTVSKVTFYVQYILIVTIILTNFNSVINITKNSILDLVAFMNSLIPILITMVLTTGSITFASTVQPVLLFVITFIGNIILDVIIPLILIATVLSILSKVSDKIQINKISKFMKSGALWLLGITLTVFVTVLSLEGTLSQNVDGITAKTTKAAVSSLVPVVGKILSDSVDAVIGCSGILKNAVGIVGIIVIISICIKPIIKLMVLMIMYYLVGAIVSPIADKKIVELLEQIGDTFKVLLGVIVASSVMFVIGITIVIQVSNSMLMYG